MPEEEEVHLRDGLDAHLVFGLEDARQGEIHPGKVGLVPVADDGNILRNAHAAQAELAAEADDGQRGVPGDRRIMDLALQVLSAEKGRSRSAPVPMKRGTPGSGTLRTSSSLARCRCPAGPERTP